MNFGTSLNSKPGYSIEDAARAIAKAAAAGYPQHGAARNRWIMSKRGPKNTLDPRIPYAYFWEEERGPSGEMLPTITILLTNRECPYRCLMCDLWQNTLDTRVPSGAIRAQIRYARERLPSARQIKLYNAGSFFDAQAVPPEDDTAIAAEISSFERVVVECHPSLIGARCLSFQEKLVGQLEVAIGLETVHPHVLQALNKRFTVYDFQHGAELLAKNHIDLRVFLLVRPPFLSEEEGVEWANRSLDIAFESGASACTLIPTRAGNGAMEALTEAGLFTPPSIASLESVQEYGLNLHKGRVFADTWDIERFHNCECSSQRSERLHWMNQHQRVPPAIFCSCCSS